LHMTYVTLYLTKLQGYTRGDIYPGTMAPGSRAAARGYLGGQVRAPCSWGPGGPDRCRSAPVHSVRSLKEYRYFLKQRSRRYTIEYQREGLLIFGLKKKNPWRDRRIYWGLSADIVSPLCFREKTQRGTTCPSS